MFNYRFNILKFIVFCLLFLFRINYSFAQKNKLDIILGYNSGFKSSITNELPNSNSYYFKNNKEGNDLISIPPINIGLNFEHKVTERTSLFLGFHVARTQTEIIFNNFDKNIDEASYVKYGYGINTYEIPIGLAHSTVLFNKIEMENYFALTINLNGLSTATSSYRLRPKDSTTDTVVLRFTDMNGFPNGNSLGLRYGFGIKPFKKLKNLEVGAYINYQFKHSFLWDEEVILENISQNLYDYQHAKIKDKPDYFNFHIKYTLVKL